METKNNNNETLLSSVDQLLEQEPAKIARAKETGTKVVGYFCPHVPEELIIAAGMIPIRLAFGGEPEPASAGEEFLKSYSCPYARSCLGYRALSSNFYYGAVDAVCVAYTCESMRRNQEYWERYFGIPAFPLGLPQTHDRFRSRPQAIQYFKKELGLLRQRLEELSGNRITDEQIRKAIRLCNRIREKQRVLFEYPRDEVSPISWRDTFRIGHAGFLINRPEYLKELEAIERQLMQGVKPEETVGQRARLMVAGSIIGSNDNKVLDIIEQSGGNVVADSVCTGSMFARKNVTLYGIIGDPIDALAERYLYNIPCPCMTDLPKRLNRITKIARDFRVHGLIYYNLKYCDTWRAEFKFINDTLYKELSVPTLLIETEYSPTDVGTIKTKIEAFLEMMGGRL